MSAPRILSLLPSTTEIVGALGLAEQLVGITHECDQCPDADGMAKVLARGVERVTTSHINPFVLDQKSIDEAVKRSLSSGLSLYGLKEEAVRRARPSVVLTQTLCTVCAPSHEEVVAVCQRLGAALADEAGHQPQVLNLEPGDINAVAETFVTIADACGVPEAGRALKERFFQELNAVRDATADAEAPSLFLFEWLEPPFFGGHWVPDQIEAAGARPVGATSGQKSAGMTWEAVQALDPDVVVVACCGFDLTRNQTDAGILLRADTEAAEAFRSLRAVREGRAFALDGNRFFARPAPSLAPGAAILARCAQDQNTSVRARLESLPFLPKENDAWTRLPRPTT